jgi:hypothetical protein
MKLDPSVVCVVLVVGCLVLLGVDNKLDVKDVMIGATAGYFGYVSNKE